jgi:hypothetical protein
MLAKQLFGNCGDCVVVGDIAEYGIRFDHAKPLKFPDCVAFIFHVEFAALDAWLNLGFELFGFPITVCVLPEAFGRLFDCVR